MPVHTPEELQPLWAEAFSAHDLEAVMALYEPEATLIPQPGQEVTGTEAIRDALSGFLALNPNFELEFKKAFQAGDIALLFSEWTMSGLTQRATLSSWKAGPLTWRIGRLMGVGSS
jgi:uncharacterized protein (TIGR02246 family)